jgi:hypothetical protein
MSVLPTPLGFADYKRKKLSDLFSLAFSRWLVAHRFWSKLRLNSAPPKSVVWLV